MNNINLDIAINNFPKHEFLIENGFEYRKEDKVYTNDSLNCFIDLKHVARIEIEELKILIAEEVINYNLNPLHEVKFIPPFMRDRIGKWHRLIKKWQRKNY